LRDKRIVRFNEWDFPIKKKVGSLQTYEYPASINDKATVIFLHSHHDYAARYAFLGGMFAEKGFRFVTHDHRGHGHSAGKIQSISEMAKDSFDVQAQLNLKTPVFLLAHGSGALQALTLAEQTEYSGLAMAAPFLCFYNYQDAQRQMGLLKFLKYFTTNVPGYSLKNLPYFYEHWHKDPMVNNDMQIT
jgi:alpha-beta hydrolase superfamily lysophospholipase